ncbi:sensor histidine kinase [Fimbriiglobus ruber]|uniref:sensor histidine kinase n=1 Tax=Fimbriiglobus ruber TaxID=1908690 RepID=UPI001379CE3E|nr:ATP-binding protein [Fimbriiglobus ruber]
MLKSAGTTDGITRDVVGEPGYYSITRDRGSMREVVMRGPGDTLILVGRSTVRMTADLRAFAWQLAGTGVLVLMVGLVGGWVISSRIVRPIRQITETAAGISAASLSGRIETAAVENELADLAGVLNAMFARLEGAFARQAQFTADASHELRTPLAVIKSNAELALSRPRESEEYRRTIEACRKAADRMTGIVDGLLLLARADNGRLDSRTEAIDLGEIVDETVGLLTAMAGEKGVRISADIDTVQLPGDAEALGRLVSNLLVNAVLYNRPGGSVSVSLRAARGSVVLTVADSGCGISEEDQSHIFERFFRVDRARSRASGGTGLGLAICRSIVDAHGGVIGFTSQVNEGTTFKVRLPLSRQGVSAIAEEN